jgi:hypothetical protein
MEILVKISMCDFILTKKTNIYLKKYIYLEIT